MRWALVAALATAAAACQARRLAARSESLGGNPAGDRRIADVPVRGFLIGVDYVDAEKGVGRNVTGELLATDPDHIWIRSWGQVQYVHARDVRRVKIELYQGHAVNAGVWTAVGTLSTLSHGFLLVLSAPIWLITGMTSTVFLANDNDAESAPAGPLWQYARFPQGLPASMHKCPIHPPPQPEAAPPTQL
jgi:hypothetical protein